MLLGRQTWAMLLAGACVALLGTPAAPALASHPRHSKLHGILPPHNPATNVAPDPNYDNCDASGSCTLEPPCYTESFQAAFSSAACEQAELAAIDNARAKEGVGPMYLPSDYNSLTGDEQLLVVIDLERVGRGLPPVAGIVASLDRVAQRGTDPAGAPAGSFEDPTFSPGFRVGKGTLFAYRCHGSNGFSCGRDGNPGAAIGAGNQIGALDSDYGWMYNDGYGGSNYDCKTPNASGCWGHRDNILGHYPTKTRYVSLTADAGLVAGRERKAEIVMGAGYLQPNGGGGPQANATAIFASVSGRRPKLVYSWKQALAAGANAAPS
jgi:hypothetical protein